MQFTEGSLGRPNSGLASLIFTVIFAAPVSAQSGSPVQGSAQPEAPSINQGPLLRERPMSTFRTVRGLIEVDAVVVDGSGKLVTGLEPSDFTLLDEGKPSKIFSVQAFNGRSAKPDPPVEVIVVMDTIDLPDRLASYEKQEVERFLRQNNGRLSHPTSIFRLGNSTLWTLAQRSADGNVLADEIDKNRQLTLARRSLHIEQGESLDLFNPQDPPGLTALKALGQIVTSERGKRGRKLLLWVGPGWGMGSGGHYFSKLNREQLFDTIDWLSTLTREARIVLFSFSVGEADLASLAMDAPITPSAALYQNYLKGVRSDREASVEALDRKVLAVQSGGRVLEPADDLRSDILHTGLTDRTPAFDLVSQINSCVDEADDFYAITFNPRDTQRTDEYHDLKVVVDKPGLTVRTKTGYYDQPYFYDLPNPAAKSVTVAELQQVLKGVRGRRDADVAREISDLELSEQLSDTTIADFKDRLSGGKSRAALAALAEASMFLDPPQAEIPARAAPDRAAQQRMIALAVDYVNKAMARLPNFIATRTTIRYEETPAHYDQTGRYPIGYEPLHRVGTARETVLYRGGNEIALPGAEKRDRRDVAAEGLNTKGTFGSTLGAVIDAAAVPGGLIWSRWEQDARGWLAVFRYSIAEKSSRFQVSYCCLPYGDGTSTFHELTGYHGQIAIDPESGAILRLTLISDLRPDLQLYRTDTRAAYSPAEIGGMPLLRSDTLVEYGPVLIGGKTYICPVKSISISRSRTIKLLTGLPGEFRAFGPFATFMNDVSFGEYHVFRGEPRILPDYSPEANGK